MISYPSRISPPRSSAAFTLLEILIAIAIIAILAALLFPLSIRASATAQRTSCMQNVRQIGNALIISTSDNSGSFPNVNTSEVTNFGTNPDPNNWLAAIRPYLGKDAKVLVCPSVKQKHPTYVPTKESDTTYLANGLVMGAKMTALPQPSRTALVQEANTHVSAAILRPRLSPVSSTRPSGGAVWFTWHYTDANTKTENYSNNHDKGGNLMFLDGHSEYRKVAELYSGDFGLEPATDPVTTSVGKAYGAAQ